MVDCSGNSPLENVGYVISDLDENGQAELIIGTTEKVTDEFYKNVILGLYTMEKDKACVNVFTGKERNRYYYIKDNIFANVGSSSAEDSFETTVKFSGSSLKDLKYITSPNEYKQMKLTSLSRWRNQSGSTTAEKIQHIDMPILDEINKNTTVGTAGSFMTAVQSAVKLLDWGTATGLDPKEIRAATVNWLSDKGNDEQVAFTKKLSLVDEAYKKLIRDGAEELLESARCKNASYPWSKAPVEVIEVVMDAVGLR